MGGWVGGWVCSFVEDEPLSCSVSASSPSCMVLSLLAVRYFQTVPSTSDPPVECSFVDFLSAFFAYIPEKSGTCDPGGHLTLDLGGWVGGWVRDGGVVGVLYLWLVF